jgi:hypothetical protein
MAGGKWAAADDAFIRPTLPRWQLEEQKRQRQTLRTFISRIRLSTPLRLFRNWAAYAHACARARRYAAAAAEQRIRAEMVEAIVQEGELAALRALMDRQVAEHERSGTLPPECTVLIEGLDHAVDEQQLREIAAAHGAVRVARLVPDARRAALAATAAAASHGGSGGARAISVPSAQHIPVQLAMLLRPKQQRGLVEYGTAGQAARAAQSLDRTRLYGGAVRARVMRPRRAATNDDEARRVHALREGTAGSGDEGEPEPEPEPEPELGLGPGPGPELGAGQHRAVRQQRPGAEPVGISPALHLQAVGARMRRMRLACEGVDWRDSAGLAPRSGSAARAVADLGLTRFLGGGGSVRSAQPPPHSSARGGFAAEDPAAALVPPATGFLLSVRRQPSRRGAAGGVAPPYRAGGAPTVTATARRPGDATAASTPEVAVSQVGHSCACIGSPWLKPCVHGATIGGGGGAGGEASRCAAGRSERDCPAWPSAAALAAGSTESARCGRGRGGHAPVGLAAASAVDRPKGAPGEAGPHARAGAAGDTAHPAGAAGVRAAVGGGGVERDGVGDRGPDAGCRGGGAAAGAVRAGAEAERRGAAGRAHRRSAGGS